MAHDFCSQLLTIFAIDRLLHMHKISQTRKIAKWPALRHQMSEFEIFEMLNF